MRRRRFLALLGGVAAGGAAGALPQELWAAAKIARVGIIDDGSDWEPFRQEMRELHYVEGQNVAFEYRRTDGLPDRLAAAAGELTAVPVNVIVVFGTPAAKAAQRATKSIPIVAISVGDPVAAGLVENFAHPGGNITGNTILSSDVVTKRLQVLRDAIPSAANVAFLWNPNNISRVAVLNELWRTTPFFGMKLVSLEARSADDFPRVFAQMSSQRPDAVLTTNDALHQMHMTEVIEFFLKNRIPGMFQLRQNVIDGGLMSYGASASDMFRRGARYVDKILRGADPGDLPIEQPTSFGLVINMKTAHAIGLQIPPSLLARADEVIE
jgi:putative tryptophan/tyrosine transport system substrate-binding protein